MSFDILQEFPNDIPRDLWLHPFNSLYFGHPAGCMMFFIRRIFMGHPVRCITFLHVLRYLHVVHDVQVGVVKRTILSCMYSIYIYDSIHGAYICACTRCICVYVFHVSCLRFRCTFVYVVLFFCSGLRSASSVNDFFLYLIAISSDYLFSLSTLVTIHLVSFLDSISKFFCATFLPFPCLPSPH